MSELNTAPSILTELQPTTRVADPAARPPRRPLLRGSVAALLCAGVAAYLLFGGSEFNQYEASLVVVYAIAALGQDWLMGRAGQISLGTAAFMAVGAYVTGAVASTSWAPFPIPIILAAAGGAVVGLLVGVTSLRFRGLYLALSTLALQFIVAFAAQRYQGSNESGLTIGIPHLWSLNFGPGSGLLWMVLIVVVLVVLALVGMYRRAPGRAWAAIRLSEEAAAVAGIDVRKWKLLAFVGSSAVIAIAGSMYAYVVGTVDYVPFSLDLAISILAVVFVGGVGSISGPFLGAIIVVLLPHWLQALSQDLAGAGGAGSWLSTNSAELSIAIYGLALLLVLLFERDGIVGIVNRLLDRVTTLRLRRPWPAQRRGSG